MKENTSRGGLFDNNFLYSLATIIIAALALAFSFITGKVQISHALFSILFFVSLVSVVGCIILAIKLDNIYREFLSYHDDILKQENLKNRIESMKQKLANVDWLKEKSVFQNFEKSDDTDEVWVLTFDFSYELYDFKDIVIEKLKKKTRYVYIYPKEARNRLHHFKGILDEADIPEEIVNECIEFYELDKSIVPLNEAIYNPRGKKKMRSIVMTPEYEFEYYVELNPEQTSRMIEKFQILMSDGKKMTLTDILDGK